MSWGKPISIHQFGFAPDLPSTTSGVLSDADFCYPTVSGARVLPSLVAQSSPVPSKAVSAFQAVLTTGAVNLFVGALERLYRYVNSGWANVSGGRVFGGSSYWSFAQAGDDTIATNNVQPVQVYGPLSTAFADLGGSPPVAKYVAVVDPGAGIGFVTGLANLASNASGWITSGPGGDTVWTQNVNDSSASGILGGEPGPITGWKTVRTFFVAFKTIGLYVGQYVGPPYIWQFQPISHQVGCASNDAIVDVGDLLVFPGPDNFYSFDGYVVQDIPNALRQWFFGVGQLGLSGTANPLYLSTIKGQYDNATGTVFWYFSSVNANPAGSYDMWVAWNKKSGKWLVGHTPQISVVVNFFQMPALTYDQFAKKYGQYQNLPHLPYNDPSFGPQPVQARAILDSNGVLKTFSGAPNFGYLQTGDIGDPIRFTRINRMRPFMGTYPAGSAATLATFVKRNAGQLNIAYKTGVKLSADGYFDFVQEAAIHQMKINFTADAELQGFSVDVTDGGDR